ncbi:MAG: hypothetical protein MUC77_13560 [Chromatiaceae bacterium]|jgi:hypothetical protein|nr:hypothetical protein [Chromatiaceae bacterium]
MKPTAGPQTPFDAKYEGSLYGLLRWEDWDRLCQRLLSDGNRRWFAYAVGTPTPGQPLPAPAMGALIAEIDALLRRDHDRDRLGIVYVDDRDEPTLVKIYDPNHLGASCGSVGYRVPPGWVLSLDPPSRIDNPAPLPGSRRRWWERLAAGWSSG